MAQISFNRAQAQLLATNFLDQIGENPDFSDIHIDESMKALVLLAGALIVSANDNLNKGGHVGDGSLSRSLKVVNPRYEGKITLDIEALVYYQFLNKGVKGTKKGTGEYSFKNSFPSQEMVNSIRKWMKNAGISTANVKKPVSKLEVKRKSIAQYDAAYAMARSIKQNGIKKTGFFDKAVQSTNRLAQQELGKALRIDIINSLPTNINGDSN